MKIILASASPRRKELLMQMGAEPVVKPSNADENIEEKNPEEFVKILSLRKVDSVFKSIEEDGIYMGADTVVAFDGKILGKPKSRQDAFDMIKSFQGVTHQVYTGVTLIIKEGKDVEKITFAEKTQVELYPISDEEIQEYVDSGEADDKAGSYGIQGPFAKFIKGIEGDYNNVVGLPVARVYQELKKYL